MMKESEYFNEQDFSASMLQPQVNANKKSKIHASFSGPTKKGQIYDSFSLQSTQQPISQFESGIGLESQSIGVGNKSNSKCSMELRQLYSLQEQLQKEYLMLVKEQSEKKKFMKEIEDEMKNYYTLLIQSKQNKSKLGETSANEQPPTNPQPLNRIVTDDGFDNCSNFVKEVIINTSKYYQIASTLLMNCTISSSELDKGSVLIGDYLCLVDFFINVLYERVSETDPFLKEITKLICCLLAKLPQLKDQEKQTLINLNTKKNLTQTNPTKANPIQTNSINTNYQKILLIFQLYLQKQCIQDYFDILSHTILKKISNISFYHVQNRNRSGVSLHRSKSIIDTDGGSLDLEKQFMDPSSSFGFKLQENWMEYFKPFQSLNDQKRALAMSYLSQIYSQADLCPMSLKVVLKYFYQCQFEYFEAKYPLKMRNQIKQLASLKLWELIQKQYFKRFDQKQSNENILYRQMSSFDIEILNDIVRMIKNFFGNRNESKFYQDQELLEVYSKSIKFIVKVVEKFLSFNQDKYTVLKQAVSGEIKEIPELKLKKNQSQIAKSPMSISSNQSDVFSNSNSNSRTTFNFDIQSSVMTPKSKSKRMDFDFSHDQINQKMRLPPQLIKIYGGCISFKQIHILLTSLKRIVTKIPNQRIINRVNRIFDMSPNLQFLTKHKLVKHPNQIQNLFIIQIQLEFHQLISNDYRNIYSKEYEDDKVKNMIRQVMCELKLKELSSRVNKRELVNKKKVNIREFELEDFKMFKKNKSPQKSPQKSKTALIAQQAQPQPNILMNLLQKISNECSRSVQGTQVQFSLHKGVSIQLLKKIKYLLYLFHKSTQLDQAQILKEMLSQVKSRSSTMVQIYQHTKFGLLSTIGNIRHYKNLLISKKQIQNKVNLRIKHIKQLEELHLTICLTSPFARSHPQFSLKDHSPSKQLSQRSFVSLQSPKRQGQKPATSSFTKLKIPHEDEYSPSKINSPKQPSTIFFEPYNKYKYRISNADDIVICETADCIHKDNIFLGLSYHAVSIQEFIEMFSNMREVNENIFFAGFIVKQDIFKKVYSKVGPQLKNYPPLNHPLATLYISKTYQKLNYSIDKINAVLYEFIEYLINDKIIKGTELPRNEVLELRKVVRDIILRGLHERLVKKIEKRIRVKFNDSRRFSLKRREQENVQQKKCLDKNNVNRGEDLPELLKDFESQEIYEEHLLAEENENEIGSKSAEVNIMQESSQIRSRQLSRTSKASRNSSKKQSQIKQALKDKFKNKQLHEQQERDLTIFQSRNDQILLLQIQTIKTSCSFDTNLQNSSQINIGQSKQSVQNEFSTRQLQQVCARYIRNINKKQTPQDKIQLLKSISDIYKLILKENTNPQTTNQTTQFNPTHYTLEKLIFRSLLIAQPDNFITNLAFIETFLHKDKMLSLDGKILNQFKTIAMNIYEMKNLNQYLDIKVANQIQYLSNNTSNTSTMKLRNTYYKECPLP